MQHRPITPAQIALCDDGGTECGRDGAGFLDTEGVLQRVEQGGGQRLGFLHTIEAGDHEVAAERRVLDDRRAQHFAVEHDGDAVAADHHVLGERDHLVLAGAVQADVDVAGARVIGEGGDDVRAVERGAAVEQQHLDALDLAFGVLVIALVRLVSGDDFLAARRRVGRASCRRRRACHPSG